MTSCGEGGRACAARPNGDGGLEERLKASEEELRHAQRLAAIGALAAGVAHDFNNTLLIVLTNAGLMLERMDANDRRSAEVRDIYDAALRASALTRQLLSSARRRRHDPTLVDPNAVLDGVGGMLARSLGKDITLTLLSGRVGAVHIDVGEMEQVVTNLVVNARDAMPMGGRLTIETREVDVSEAPAGATPGRYVMLLVTDTGTGMDDWTKARMFEPFFTTKEPGRGTGLGLDLVREIVERSGGFIDVRSAPREGTTFAIHLPCVADGPLRSARSATSTRRFVATRPCSSSRGTIMCAPRCRPLSPRTATTCSAHATPAKRS